MTEQSGTGPEPVGSVSEEAAKLFAALADAARAKGSSVGDAAGSAASGLSGALHDVSEHIATGGEDCRYCPVCQVIALVRGTSPEVKSHLVIAANSLVQAAAGILATQVPAEQKGDGVEKIDLDDAGDEDWES